MEICFFWDDEDGACVPNCRSSVLNENGVDFLACLFTDHGGQKYESSIPWLDEGLSRIRLVKSGVVEKADWSRDSWGVELSKSLAKIYSLYDEDCCSIINIDEFERALLGWKGFILSV
ncbi:MULTISPECIES: hypothetical protein [Pseudomonas]|uniref:hypothetical protein n=1 Tax=Pseudomonas TaxID=286 RepID=UPI00209821F8|nr:MULTISPECIES: hypothetical protein [Pseudomonas chlororaphis group]MCO7580453.1 hypothetical protein [Pseudomonas protegens]MCO7586532.1 hypothetical protein [Pseudomonas chlororaphis]MCO7603539.1 hypothetical protein [Pseudomonas chlororaphis]MDP9536776.1 hypothetical protein [Pseudomonas protegens]